MIPTPGGMALRLAFQSFHLNQRVGTHILHQCDGTNPIRHPHLFFKGADNPLVHMTSLSLCVFCVPVYSMAFPVFQLPAAWSLEAALPITPNRFCPEIYKLQGNSPEEGRQFP